MMIFNRNGFGYLSRSRNVAAKEGGFIRIADSFSMLSALSSSDMETKQVIPSVCFPKTPVSLSCFMADITASMKNFSPGRLL